MIKIQPAPSAPKFFFNISEILPCVNLLRQHCNDKLCRPLGQHEAEQLSSCTKSAQLGLSTVSIPESNLSAGAGQHGLLEQGALPANWPHHLLCAFPPLPLILSTLSRIQQQWVQYLVCGPRMIGKILVSTMAFEFGCNTLIASSTTEIWHLQPGHLNLWCERVVAWCDLPTEDSELSRKHSRTQLPLVNCRWKLF